MLSAEALDTDGLPDSFPYWAFWQERCATLLPRPCGISAVLASSALAFQIVKYLGAGYLIYWGTKTLRTKEHQLLAASGGETRLARIFGQGFLVNLLNPKTALFFLAFLPQFVDQAPGHLTLQILQLGILFALMS